MIQMYFGLSWAKISPTTLFPWYERMTSLQGVTIPWIHPEQCTLNSRDRGSRFRSLPTPAHLEM